MRKIMDPILHVVSILEYWATILGPFGDPGGASRGLVVCSVRGLGQLLRLRLVALRKLLGFPTWASESNCQGAGTETPSHVPHPD